MVRFGKDAKNKTIYWHPIRTDGYFTQSPHQGSKSRISGIGRIPERLHFCTVKTNQP
jgi:hypothetical protein